MSSPTPGLAEERLTLLPDPRLSAVAPLLEERLEVSGRQVTAGNFASLLDPLIICSGPAQAGLLDAFTPGPVAVSHGSQAKTDGTPLAVKSRKLVQEAPKIYPSGLVGQGKEASRRVVVDVEAQRAYLFVGGKLAFEAPISTASKGRTTPRGTITITEKIRSGKHSTIYKSPMPYWNRLDQSAIGMHTGQLPAYPASHGCIRLPDESARFIFDNAPKGTPVQVVDALDAAPQSGNATAGLMASNP